MSSDNVPIPEFLSSLGLQDREVQLEARARLEAAGLTNPRKSRIALWKATPAREVLEQHLAVLCSECISDGRPARGRTVIPAFQRPDCWHCRGSAHGLVVNDAVKALKASGLSRVVVVGGSPNARAELERYFGGHLELRTVDGLARVPARVARGHIGWADVVCIWSTTQLHHSVSDAYHSAPRVCVAARRGVGAVAEALLNHARGRSLRKAA